MTAWNPESEVGFSWLGLSVPYRASPLWLSNLHPYSRDISTSLHSFSFRIHVDDGLIPQFGTHIFSYSQICHVHVHIIKCGQSCQAMNPSGSPAPVTPFMSKNGRVGSPGITISPVTEISDLDGSSGNHVNGEGQSPKKKQKRNKPTLSCHECVERKTKVSEVCCAL